MTGYFNTGNVMVVFLTAPIMAGISDAVGRYPIIILEMVAVTIPNVCLFLKYARLTSIGCSPWNGACVVHGAVGNGLCSGAC